MKDRVSTYPGRVRLTPVSGQTNVYDLERADQPTETGTPLNKANLLNDAVAEFLGLENTAVPNDAFQILGAKQKRKLCFDSIEQSGTWTVPSSLYGGKIFVIVVGGGGSGGAGKSSTSTAGGGGGSGHISFGVINVTPNQNISVVIGAGGTGVSGTTNGNNGGATTFGTLSANGGSGGYSVQNNGYGGDGGAGGGGQFKGGDASFGGGGGVYGSRQNVTSQAGNGGPYGGGGACSTSSTQYPKAPGEGGTYGTTGGNGVTPPDVGVAYMGSMEMWNLASDYYGVPRVDLQTAMTPSTRGNNKGSSYDSIYKAAGGSGLGSMGGHTWSGTSAYLGGGGGFLANGNYHSEGGGGGLFGYMGTETQIKGGGGFFAAGSSKLRGSGGNGSAGTSATSVAGGNGVVAIWYYITPTNYLGENI